MKLHPSISKHIRQFFLKQGIGKGVAWSTAVSVLFSIIITCLFATILKIKPGIYGYSIAVITPAVIASFASYINLSLYFELEQTRTEMHDLATTDELTKIFNRRYFFEQADREIKRSQRNGCPLTIVLFDIDDFKLINDHHGHLAGDMVLQETCKACQAIIRPYDIFARFGGEEFIFLLPNTDEARAMAFAERLRDVIASQVVLFDQDSMQITISIGVSVFNPVMDTLDDLISRADKALYKAKDFGKNRLAIS